MSEFHHIRWEEHGDVTVVRLVDNQLSDLMIQGDLRTELDELVSQRKPRKLLVSFDVVTFTTTGAIETLLRLRKCVQEYGGEVKLCGMSDLVRQAFRVLNLEGRMFEICDSEEAGVAAFEN